MATAVLNRLIVRAWVNLERAMAFMRRRWRFIRTRPFPKTGRGRK
jgi:hypothetical protein